MNDAIRQPHDPSTLFRLAETEATRRGISARWREDAVSEYVISAYRAGLRHAGDGNVQAFQCLSGAGALRQYVRREIRYERLAPAGCLPDAVRVSLEYREQGPDGESVALAETIVDETTPPPDAHLFLVELRAAIAKGMNWLYPGQREAVRRVWLEGEPERDAATRMAVTRHELRETLADVRSFFQAYFREYYCDFGK